MDQHCTLSWAAFSNVQSPSPVKKKGLQMFRWNQMFYFVPISSNPVTRHHLAFAPSCQVFVQIDKISLSLLSFKVNSASFYQPSLCVRCSSSFITFLTLLRTPVCPVPFSCAEKPRTGCSAPGVASPMLDRGKVSPFLACWHSFA